MTRDNGDKGGLPDLRKRIDAVDDQILKLLKERMDVVAEVAAYKKHTGTRIRDLARERQLLDARKQRAAELGLAPEPVEAIYRQVMLSSRDYQAALGAIAPQQVVPRQVTVIGGHGGMGRLMVGMFTDLGHQVSVVDLGTDASAVEAARTADVVIIAVPIAVTEAVIREVGPHVRADALLMDITSVKVGPLAAMLEATSESGASVVGGHPMFGPGVHSLIGQRMVLCEGRGEVWFEWVRTMFETRGFQVTQASAAEHDRAMALVQVLNHFQTQVFGLALARSSVPLAESLRFTSPAYLMELYMMGRHFAQDPTLYAGIEMRNPLTGDMTRAFCLAARELADILAAGDEPRFVAMFQEVRAFLGDFASEASVQSSYLMDRLIERAMG